MAKTKTTKPAQRTWRIVPRGIASEGQGARKLSITLASDSNGSSMHPPEMDGGAMFADFAGLSGAYRQLEKLRANLESVRRRIASLEADKEAAEVDLSDDGATDRYGAAVRELAVQHSLHDACLAATRKAFQQARSEAADFVANRGQLLFAAAMKESNAAFADLQAEFSQHPTLTKFSDAQAVLQMLSQSRDYYASGMLSQLGAEPQPLPEPAEV